MYRSECLPFSQIPHHTALFLDFLYHFQKLERFLPEKLQPEQAKNAAAKLNYDPARRAAVAAVLERQNGDWGMSEAARRNLRRFRAGAAAVVSGHQLSFFGGPAYSFYKALSAIKMAEEITAAGTECVPIFWLASEDHDLAEIDHVVLPFGAAQDKPASPQALETLRVGAKGRDGSPVGRLRLEE